MRNLLAALAWTIGVGVFTGRARAAEVTVVDATGQPAASATVTCIDPPDKTVVPIADGRGPISGSCRRVRCESPDFLPAEAEVTAAGARCALQPAIVLRGDLPPGTVTTGLEARLLDAAGAKAAVTVARIAPAPPGSGAPSFSFPPAKPGRTTMEIARKESGWSCRADLGPLPAGRRSIAPAWREPIPVTALVTGSDGNPASDVTVTASSPRPGMTRHGRKASPIGAWSCAPSSDGAAKTDAQGVVHLPIDLNGEALLVAGDWKEPRGLAHAVIDRRPADRVLLKLTPPMRIRAKVVDEKDRPVACESLIADSHADAVWLNAAVPGAALTTSCDAHGQFLLGPMMPTTQTVEVRPKIGLPLRISVDPPAAGTVADLGVLRVSTGENIRVTVQDDAGHPVSGAIVKARGAAGIVLIVFGTTGEDGGVALSGLPKSASISLDVNAKGYMRARKTDLNLDGSPFLIQLSRGATVSGKVRDQDGLGVGGASVELTGDTEHGPWREETEADGTFELDGVADGTSRLTATAAGFAKSDPAAVEIRDHRSVDDVSITLSPAKGISGHVFDPTGLALPGARVRLMSSLSEDAGAAIADVVSGADGAYRIQAAAPTDAWLVATKDGFGPGVARGSDAAAHSDDVPLALMEPASLVVHIAPGARTSRRLGIKDGAGLERSVPTGGSPDFKFTDLAPGTGEARLGGTAGHDVTLTARQTAEVTLDAGAAIVGRVTVEGAPAPRCRVTAVQLIDEGGMLSDGGSFTDERGRYRIDGLAAGDYRIAAVGEDGRGETKTQIAEGETAHLDLTLRAIRLIGRVIDAASGKPVPGVFLSASPGGTTSNSSMGTSSSGDPGELGFEVTIGSNGALSARTNAEGEARLALASPGSYELAVYDSAYEPWKDTVAIGDGTTTKRISLTRKPDRPEAKPHVIVTIRTDPPGMSGEIVCARAGNTSSSSPVADRFDCGEMESGPAEVLFHVEGYGRGRTAFEVPQTGDVNVEVDVVRGGTVIVPIAQQSTARPKVTDVSGYDWSDMKGNMAFLAKIEDVPRVGRAWVFRDLPPGTYVATVEGTARSAVSVVPGGTATAY